MPAKSLDYGGFISKIFTPCLLVGRQQNGCSKRLRGLHRAQLSSVNRLAFIVRELANAIGDGYSRDGAPDGFCLRKTPTNKVG